MTTTTSNHPTTTRVDLARDVAVGASLAAAVLYLLIGLGVLSVGQSTASDGTPDLLAFGVLMASVFTISAVLLGRFRGRVLWAAVGIVQMIVLIGYVAMANLREPPFDLWGLLIKACQLIVLAAMAYLILHPVAAPSGRSDPMHGSVA